MYIWQTNEQHQKWSPRCTHKFTTIRQTLHKRAWTAAQDTPTRIIGGSVAEHASLQRSDWLAVTAKHCRWRLPASSLGQYDDIECLHGEMRRKIRWPPTRAACKLGSQISGTLQPRTTATMWHCWGDDTSSVVTLWGLKCKKLPPISRKRLRISQTSFGKSWHSLVPTKPAHLTGTQGLPFWVRCARTKNHVLPPLEKLAALIFLLNIFMARGFGALWIPRFKKKSVIDISRNGGLN